MSKTIKAALDRQSFDLVTSIETPIFTVFDLLTAIGAIGDVVAQNYSDEIGSALHRLVALSKEQWATVEDGRGELFRVLHPKRDDAVVASVLEART